MALYLCIFILLGGVVADPIRAHRGVLMFLNEALATTTEKTVTSTFTANGNPDPNPPNKPEIDPDSEEISFTDLSEETSEESLTIVLKDPDSQAVPAANPQLKTRTAADEMIRRWAQDRGSRETNNPDSEEDPNASGAQALCPGRKAEPASVPDDESRELQDLDSLEVNCGRPAPAGNRREAAYDESQGLGSPERSPVASSQMKWRPSHPAKSQRA